MKKSFVCWSILPDEGLSAGFCSQELQVKSESFPQKFSLVKYVIQDQGVYFIILVIHQEKAHQIKDIHNIKHANRRPISVRLPDVDLILTLFHIQSFLQTCEQKSVACHRTKKYEKLDRSWWLGGEALSNPLTWVTDIAS